MLFLLFFFYGYGDHRDLHVLTHSVPTRRSSDLVNGDSLAYTEPRVLVTPLFRTPDAEPVEWRKDIKFDLGQGMRSEEHTSELQSLMRISYAVFCLKKKNKNHVTKRMFMPT